MPAPRPPASSSLRPVNGGDGEKPVNASPAKAAAAAEAVMEEDEEAGGDAAARASPTLVHRLKCARSILALAVTDEYIYAGTQGGQILVFAIRTFESVRAIEAHKGSVLGLCLSEDERWLFSSAGDRFVNLWDTTSFKHLASIYSYYDIGDIFCVSYSSRLGHVYLGSQNTSIQWHDLTNYESRPLPDPQSHPSLRPDRFFDSGPGGSPSPSPRRSSSDTSVMGRARTGRNLEIAKDHIYQFAHYGYVYCMLIAKNISFANHVAEEMLISGGGDGTIKLWRLLGEDGGGIEEIGELQDGRDEGESVLTMILDGTLLYSGRMDGEINAWDLETRQLLRIIKAHDEDVLSLAVGGGMVFSAAINGEVKKFNRRYECVNTWKAHEGRVLASAFTKSQDRLMYITGSNDDTVALWDVTDCSMSPAAASSKTSQGQLLDSLRQFISYRTVSSDPRYQQDCRRGASYLRSVLKKFGAWTEMLNTDEGFNPIVYALFKGTVSSTQKRRRILFYGHYDVIPAENLRKKWRTDPFSMAGVDGYLYGRGISDNKGPIMAAIYAVADIVGQKSLDSDIVFLVEGEEESGSRGFKRAIRRNKELIGHVDWIILANSYWLDDEMPCLNYGLRGVVHASVQIESEHPDLHSGVDGSRLLDEPVKDLVMLLSKLSGPHGRIQLPGFYDPILPVTKSERALYDDISRYLLEHDPTLSTPESLTSSLMERWRNASLTIHNFKNSGPNNSSVIPQAAEAALSFRLVPNQECDVVIETLTDFLKAEFEKLESGNHLTVRINRFAEPWLGDPTNEIFQALEKAIAEVWSPYDRRRRASVGAMASANGVPPLQTARRPSEGKLPPTTSSALAMSSVSPPTSPTSPAAAVRPAATNNFDWSAIHDDDAASNSSPVQAQTEAQGQPPPRRKSTGKPSNGSASTTASPTSSRRRSGQHDAKPAAAAPGPAEQPAPPTSRKEKAKKPLYIREGGSIPAVRFLEVEFGAPAAHLPCGQASDNAHLDNERFRVLNLWNSKEIFRRVFVELGSCPR